MSLLAQSAGQIVEAVPPRPTARPRVPFTVELSSDWASVAGEWSGAATPFQEAAWLGAWYRALGGRQGLVPLLVTVRDGATGEVAVRLPFVRRRVGRLDVIEFADLHLTDFNAPALGPAAPRDTQSARLLWRQVRRALPRADLVRLTKMPVSLNGRPNPLALLPGLVPCAVNGNVVQIGDDWDAWRHSLGKPARKELERSWRVFRREPEAEFEIVTDPGRLHAVASAMAQQQQERIRLKGLDYILAEPDIVGFYREIIDHGVPNGSAILTALTVGEEIVAALLCVRDDSTCVMIRISNAGGRWSACSPGRLIVDRTIAALHAQGVRSFDLSLGNYDYKRRFGVKPVPLVDLIRPLGPLGLPAAWRAWAVSELRKRPALYAGLRTLLRRR